MTEKEWLRENDPTAMVASLRGIVSDRKLRLFACSCERAQNENKGDRADASQRDWIKATEMFIEGVISPAEWERVRNGRHSTLHANSHAEHASRGACVDAGRHNLHLGHEFDEANRAREAARQITVLRDVFGNPFQPVAFDPSLRTSTAVAIAKGMYDSRDFAAMPLLADALQDAGCADDRILEHCRGREPHVKGCWVVDLVLGKE